MQRLATWRIVGFLGAVVVAATIATLLRDDSNSAARGGTSLSRPVRSAFTGEISPAVDFISGFVYTPLCNQRGPLVATVTAGEITAGQTLPVRNCLSPTPTSGEHESPPRCDTQQLALAIKRPRLSSFSCRCRATSRAGKVLRRGDADQSARFRCRRRASRASLIRWLRQVPGRDRAGYVPSCRFSFLPWCGQRGPFLAVVTAGPYKARRELPHPGAWGVDVVDGVGIPF